MRTLGGFDERRGESVAAMQVKAERGIERALDSVDADLSIALSGMAVSAGEERARIKDGKIESSTGGKLAHIHIATEGAGRTGAKFAVDIGSNAHHSTEGTKWDHGGLKSASFVREQLPMKKKWFAEALLEKAEAWNDARISPAMVGQFENFNFEDIAGMCAADEDRTGEGMDETAVDGR
jgi:hypothetical protein